MSSHREVEKGREVSGFKWEGKRKGGEVPIVEKERKKKLWKKEEKKKELREKPELERTKGFKPKMG